MYIAIKFRFWRWLAAAIIACLLLVFVPLIFTSATEAKVVYLTFDDGPSGVTPRLLKVLAKHNVKATFFVTGQYEDHFPVLRQIAEEGHLVALHSYTHDFSEIYSSTDAFWSDIARLETLIETETGSRPLPLLRFPGGSSNTVSYRYGGRHIMDTLVAQCAEKGYAYCDWTIDTRDALGSTISADALCRRVVSGVKNNPVIVVLMHDGPEQKTAPEAADAIITQLKAKGYVFDMVDHLPQAVHHRMPG